MDKKGWGTVGKQEYQDRCIDFVRCVPALWSNNKLCGTWLELVGDYNSTKNFLNKLEGHECKVVGVTNKKDTNPDMVRLQSEFPNHTWSSSSTGILTRLDRYALKDSILFEDVTVYNLDFTHGTNSDEYMKKLHYLKKAIGRTLQKYPAAVLFLNTTTTPWMLKDRALRLDAHSAAIEKQLHGYLSGRRISIPRLTKEEVDRVSDPSFEGYVSSYDIYRSQQWYMANLQLVIR